MNGLLHAIQLDEKGGAKSIELSELESYKSQSSPIWLHFDFTTEPTRHWFKHESGLPDIICDALLADNSRPRVTKTPHGTLLFLRGVNLNPRQTPEDMVSLRMFIYDNVMITTRRRRLLSVHDVYQQLLDGNGPLSLSELVCQLTENLTSRMHGVIEDLEESLDDLEEIVLDSPLKADHQQLSLLRRQSTMLKRYIRPQREAIWQLSQQHFAWLHDDHKPKLVEVANHLTRYIEELDTNFERAQIIYEEQTSALSEQLNSRMYIMSVVAALFLPLGFLTGLLGINVGGVPGVENPYAFYIFSGTLLVLTFGLGVLFRMKRWL